VKPTKLDRIETGVAWFDSWIDRIVSAIERALSVDVSPPLQIRRGPDGTQIAWSMPVFAHAKSGGSGIAAMSGTTPGVADVTLWDFDGTTLTSQTVTVKAYNKSATAVGNNKHLILVMVDKWWFVDWEDCG
jgi:hypothetical protein